MNAVGAVPASVTGAVPELSVCDPDGRVGTPIVPTGYCENLSEPVVLKLLPSSAVTIVLGFEDPIVLGRDPWTSGRHASVLVAAGGSTADAVLEGRQRGMVLRCPPPVAYTLLGQPPALASRDPLDIEAVLGPEVVHISDRLAAAPDRACRFAVVEQWVRRRLAAGPRPDPAVVLAWRSITAGQGTVRIGDLARGIGMSRRHLLRRFREQVGMSPRTVGRVARLERAAALLGAGPTRLGSVAADAGFADQAHLAREIRATTGWTPTGLRERLAG